MNILHKILFVTFINCPLFTDTHGMHYRLMTRLVDVCQTIKHNFLFIALALFKKKNSSLSTSSTIIQQRLTSIEKNIRNDEKRAIHLLVTHYNLSKEQLQSIISIM